MHMKWKVFALLESSFSVLLSVIAIILALFIMTATGGTGTTEVIAIADVVLSVVLTLVAHGQLIGSFRRLPPGEMRSPQPGSPAIPILAVLLFLGTVAFLPLGGQASWTDFARVYVTYAVAPPVALALIARALVVLSTRRPASKPLS